MVAASNMSTSNSGVVLTIPANTQWIGTVQISATLTVGIGGAAVSAVPQVAISGTPLNMNNGDVVCAVALACPAVAVTSLLGAQTTASSTSGVTIIRAGSTQVQLVLTFGSGVTAVANAAGEMRT